jgi:hypothetical protein
MSIQVKVTASTLYTAPFWQGRMVVNGQMHYAFHAWLRGVGRVRVFGMDVAHAWENIMTKYPNNRIIIQPRPAPPISQILG